MTADQTPPARPRVHRLRRARLNVDYVDASLAARLRSRRFRWIMMTVLVAVFLGAALVTNLAIANFMSEPMKTVFSVGYGVGCSLLASFSVFAYLGHRDLAELVEETPLGLRLLNIVPRMRSDKGRVVIVLPVFPVLPGDATKHIAMSQGGKFTTTGLDIRRSAHSRRDMLVVHDILRLFYQAGLPRPIVLKDDNFCTQILEHKSSDGPLKVRENTDQVKAEQFTVSAILSVGLFSNRFTLAMSQDPRVPFGFEGIASSGSDSANVRQLRELKIRRPLVAGRPHTDGYDHDTIKMPDDESSGPDTGLIARLNFKDIPVSFIGGMTALATVRLGDFLFNEPDLISEFPDVAQFASTRSNQTFCAVVACPGAGKRFETGFKPRVVYWDEEDHGGVQNVTAVSVAKPVIHSNSTSTVDVRGHEGPTPEQPSQTEGDSSIAG